MGMRFQSRRPEPLEATQGAHSAEKASLGPKPKEPSLARDLIRVLVKLALIAVGGFLLFSFVFGVYRVSDSYMKPSIKDGDVVMYYRLDRTFAAGEVVVVEYGGRAICGRVVATAGDEVNIDSQGLLVNGSYQLEPDITEDTTQVADGVTFPLTVPEGSVFLLGDNRTSAVDSRIYGCVPNENILGKVVEQLRRRGF